MLREEVLFQKSEVVDEPTAGEPKRAPGIAPCPTIKEQRVQALQELPKGFYVCTAGRRKIKRLHLLHQCWMVPESGLFCLQLCRQIHATSGRLRRSVQDVCSQERTPAQQCKRFRV